MIYEVTLHARTAIAAEYLAWLRVHVAAMAALPGFTAARLFALDEASGIEAGWCVHYVLRDRAALDAYLRDHAPRMRAEGIARFGEAFRAERRLLVPLDY